MFRHHRLATAGLVAAGVAALAASTAPSATADPNPAPPPYRTYAAVGSDTTQDIWSALTNGKKAPIKDVGSWDSVPIGSQIKTKAAGATFLRPAGSDGLRALSAVWDPNSTHQYPADTNGNTVALVNDEVDFARTTSAPVAGSGLTYLPFARDAVSVAIKPYSSGSTPTNFTTAQLAAIYGGSDDNTAGTGITYDPNTTLPVLNGKILEPVLPAASFGTRTFFQAAIGITTADLASYVEPPASTLPVNDGRVLTDEGELIPFSAAQWIAQNNNLVNNTTTGVNLTSINGSAAISGKPGKLKAGPLFGHVNSAKQYDTVPTPGIGTFNRDTYNVVPTAFIDGSAPSGAALVTKLTGTGTGTLGNSAAQKLIAKYGFGVLAYYGSSANFRSGAYVH